MKLSEAIKAGYTLVGVEGEIITSVKHHTATQVYQCKTAKGSLKFVSDSMEASNPLLQLIIVTSFNEDTAAALLLADAAPIMTKDLIPGGGFNNMLGRAVVERAEYENRHAINESGRLSKVDWDKMTANGLSRTKPTL